MVKISVGFRLSDQAIGHLEQITRATGATKTATVETALALMAEKFKGEKMKTKDNIVENTYDAMIPGYKDGVAYENTENGDVRIVSLSSNEFDRELSSPPWEEIYRVEASFSPEDIDMMENEEELAELQAFRDAGKGDWKEFLGEKEYRDRLIETLNQL